MYAPVSFLNEFKFKLSSSLWRICAEGYGKHSCVHAGYPSNYHFPILDIYFHYRARSPTSPVPDFHYHPFTGRGTRGEDSVKKSKLNPSVRLQ